VVGRGLGVAEALLEDRSEVKVVGPEHALGGDKRRSMTSRRALAAA
jgi:hypothetical protein